MSTEPRTVQDGATVEVSRTQVWMWLRHRTALDDGRTVDRRLVQRILDEEFGRALAELSSDPGPPARLAAARDIVEEATFVAEYPASITTEAYARHLVDVLPSPCPTDQRGGARSGVRSLSPTRTKIVEPVAVGVA
ncbi:hypothetical protein AB2L27_10380 [Kineococcus sp. LSe6-4]|uniref:Malate synthase C-terminal domain-containing protein n=1 Tax=Kineococcus halophytocola TaxID=3234027 RepID=A0ABV4H0R6_9ACTN